MGVISSNLTSDNKDRSFLFVWTILLTHSLSRCSISPEGQFTIGNVNNNSVLQTSGSVGTRPSTALEDKSSLSTVPGESPTEVSLAPSDPAPTPSESSSNPPDSSSNPPDLSSNPEPSLNPSESSEPLSDGELPEMDMPENESPIRRSSRGRSNDNAKETDKNNDVWRLEDPYDASGNHPQPYSRGRVLLDKRDVKKKNELNKNTNHTMGTIDYSNPADLLFCVSSADLDVFKYAH